MENITELSCACGNCGQIIKYLPENGGQIVECPQCKKKSCLPALSSLKLTPPLIPPSKPCPVCGSDLNAYALTCETCENRRRRNLKLIIGVMSAVAVLGIGWLILKRFYSPRQPQLTHSKALLPQPWVKTVKSANDFKIGKFWLESKRGSDVVVAAGDIQNTSANLYLHLKADVDLLDDKGVKIGSVSDEISQLLPAKTWRVIAAVKDPRAKSARFASLREIP
jgi:predicted nucleic acid-binding Zn ribbon protein